MANGDSCNPDFKALWKVALVEDPVQAIGLSSSDENSDDEVHKWRCDQPPSNALQHGLGSPSGKQEPVARAALAIAGLVSRQQSAERAAHGRPWSMQMAAQ